MRVCVFWGGIHSCDHMISWNCPIMENGSLINLYLTIIYILACANRVEISFINLFYPAPPVLALYLRDGNLCSSLFFLFFFRSFFLFFCLNINYRKKYALPFVWQKSNFIWEYDFMEYESEENE